MMCHSCERPIPRMRLAAVPTTRYCVRCQEQHEQRITSGDWQVANALVEMGEVDMSEMFGSNR